MGCFVTTRSPGSSGFQTRYSLCYSPLYAHAAEVSLPIFKCAPKHSLKWLYMNHEYVLVPSPVYSNQVKSESEGPVIGGTHTV